MGADAEHEGDETFDVYRRAKGRADAELAASGLDYDRPARRPHRRAGDGQGLRVGERRARIDPRTDVAAVLAAVLEDAAAVGKTFEVISGRTPIEAAVAAL